MEPDADKKTEGASHRPLPHVDMPLLREDRIASRRRKVALLILVVTVVVGAALTASIARRARGTKSVAPSVAPSDVHALDAGVVEPAVATTQDAAAEAAAALVRVEAPGEHVAPDAGAPVTEGAASRTTSRFGTSPAFHSALTHAGLSNAEATALEGALEPVLDFRRCRPEHALVVERDSAGKLLRFEYRTGATDYVAVTRNARGTLEGQRVHVPVETLRLVRAGRVQGSLGDALAGVGLGAALVSSFVEAFSGRADFGNDTRSGDVFRVIVEEERIHGQFLRFGRVHALRYDGAGTGHLEAYWFEAPGERGQFYDVEGRELHGGWLVTPLRYDHVSSPFDPRRLHPILRRIQPHNGIDFSAPTGTPVWAAAPGTVTWAGPKGPNGNLIAITHGGGYQSYYAHLHRIQPGITRGAHVNQRQAIGQVGTTGRSTGPHLHFGLKRGSAFVDPARVLNGPGRQLAGGALAQYRRVTRTLSRELAEAPVATPRATAANADAH